MRGYGNGNVGEGIGAWRYRHGVTGEGIWSRGYMGEGMWAARIGTRGYGHGDTDEGIGASVYG